MPVPERTDVEKYVRGQVAAAVASAFIKNRGDQASTPQLAEEVQKQTDAIIAQLDAT